MIVGLDVDDVLLDLVPTWLEEYNEEWEDNLAPHDIDTWDFWKHVRPECGKRIYGYLRPEMYLKISPIAGAAQFVQDIRDRGHTPRYITACGDNKLLSKVFAMAKWQCLARHDICQEGELLLPGKDKTRAPVDMLVDDRVHNCTEFRNGMSILFRQPWNQWYNEDEHTHVERADSFTEALALIDYYREEGP